MEPIGSSATEKIRELARRWFEEAWNERRDDVFADLVDAGCLGHHEDRVTQGPGEVKAMRDVMVGLIPDIKVTIEAILVEGQEAVVRWRFAGTASSQARPVEFHGMTWLKFRDGRIIEGWDRWNQGGFVQQISAA